LIGKLSFLLRELTKEKLDNEKITIKLEVLLELFMTGI